MSQQLSEQQFEDPRALHQMLEQRVAFILDEASRQGADACEVAVSQNTGLSVGVRQGEVAIRASASPCIWTGARGRPVPRIPRTRPSARP